MKCTHQFIFCILSAWLAISPFAHATSNQFNADPTGDGTESKAQIRARIHTELGAGYYSRGQYQIALDELHQALDADSRDAQAYGVLGLVYMALNEDRLAQENFERAISLAPDQSDIRNNYGGFLCNRHHVSEALKQFDIATSNPLYNSPQTALTNAGLCAAQAGETTQAQTYLEKSLREDDNQPLAQTALAQLYYQQGRYTEASTLISPLISNQPTPALLWLSLRIARQTNDSNTAASDGIVLRNQFPNAPETQLFLQGKFN